jgi:hypothetical protein
VVSGKLLPPYNKGVIDGVMLAFLPFVSVRPGANGANQIELDS